MFIVRKIVLFEYNIIQSFRGDIIPGMTLTLGTHIIWYNIIITRIGVIRYDIVLYVYMFTLLIATHIITAINYYSECSLIIIRRSGPTTISILRLVSLRGILFYVWWLQYNFVINYAESKHYAIGTNHILN